MPKLDRGLIVLPTQQNKLPITLGRKVDEPGVNIFDQNVKRLECPNRLLNRYDVARCLGERFAAPIKHGGLDRRPELRLELHDVRSRGEHSFDERANLGQERIRLGNGVESIIHANSFKDYFFLGQAAL